MAMTKMKEKIDGMNYVFVVLETTYTYIYTYI